jgi:preprotein translocase subunit SecE
MASSNIETVNHAADMVKTLVAACLVVLSVVAFYYLGDKGGLAQWASLLGGLILALVVFFTSIHGKQLIAFAKDATREVQKVVWPTRKEATQMTIYVFAFVAIMAAFLWFTDKTLEWVIYDLILGWKK